MTCVPDQQTASITHWLGRAVTAGIAIALLAALALVCYGWGTDAGRDRATGGFLSGMVASAMVFVGAAISLVAAIPAFYLVRRRHPGRRMAGKLILAAIPLGWSAWIAGEGAAFQAGGSVDYGGSITVEVMAPGGLEIEYGQRELPATCESVIGDPGSLRVVRGGETEAQEHIFLGLRALVSGPARMELAPSLSGNLDFGAIFIPVDGYGLTVVETSEDGLRGSLTARGRRLLAYVDYPDAPIEVEIQVTWECQAPPT